MILGYKGEDLVISLQTENPDGTVKTDVTAALISIYYLDATHTKQYLVTNAAMSIQNGLVSYIWNTPLEPIQDDVIAEVSLTDAGAYTAHELIGIKISDYPAGGTGGTGGLTSQEHTWLYSAYTKTLGLAFDINSYVKANIQAVVNDSVTGLADFQAAEIDLSGLALQSTLLSVQTTVNTIESAVGGDLAQQATLLQMQTTLNGVASQNSTILSNNTTILTNTNTLLGRIPATMTADILFMKSILGGKLFIDFQTGKMYFSDINNSSNVIHTMQLLGAQGQNTNKVGLSYGRVPE